MEKSLGLVLFLLIILYIAPVFASNLYVSPSGNDTNDCLSSEMPCLTIQAAVDKASGGDVVNIAAGTYNATGLTAVFIAKPLTLQGAGMDLTIIDAGRWSRMGTGSPKGIHIASDNVTVKDMTIQEFRGNQFFTFGYGIVFRNWARDDPDESESIIQYSGGMVENVRVRNNFFSIYSLLFNDLVIKNNLIENSTSDGMFIARSSNNARIEGNAVSSLGAHGIWIGKDWTGRGWTSSNNCTISGNTVSSAYEAGIIFSAGANCTITGNNVTGAQGRGWSFGAISVKDGSDNVAVVRNKVYNNPTIGIGVDGDSANISIHYNRIYGNDGYELRSVSSFVDAVWNWWGTDNNSTIASKLDGNILYTPYFTNLEMTNLSNLPPVVDAGPDRIANSSFVQDAAVSDVDSNPLISGWRKVSGPGNLTFVSAGRDDVEIAADADGIYVIRLTVNDNERNVAYDEFVLMWDTTPPIIDDNIPSEWQTDNVSAVLEASDALSGVASTQYCIDKNDSCIPSIEYAPVTISEEGVSYFRYSSTDAAGNSRLVTKSVRIDKTEPTISDNYALDGIWTRKNQIITLSPADNISGISTVRYCSGDGCNPASGTVLSSPYRLSYNTNQNRIVRYQAWDAAAMSSPVGSFNVKIDKTAPSIILNLTPLDSVGGVNYISETTNISAEVSDSLSGINSSSCQYSVNGTWLQASYSSGRCMADVVNTSDASSISMRVSDNAGNTASSSIAVTLPTKDAADGLTFSSIKGSNKDNNSVMSDLNLIRFGKAGTGTTIRWLSDSPFVRAADGRVTRPEFGRTDVTVELTAIISKTGYRDVTKKFRILVMTETMS
ncbi:MAG: right-handed parallel beta-helix repeat-containing protein, partial [Candidatus Aenigmarchaeota archaeon]|nr:right-handed parallel beta-helix repeat-containing protein [Candidatus Aenigmarchaeota archaeon]